MIKLYYFHEGEFHRNGINWFPRMSPRLLVLLDTLRHEWGKPIHISPADGSLGRFAGSSFSQHNVAKWQEVRAADVMTELEDAWDARSLLRIAHGLGFTGTGFYPDWRVNDVAAPGFHLDVRHDREPGDPATWGKVNNLQGHVVQVSVSEALEAMI